jgi:hypothetical protein
VPELSLSSPCAVLGLLRAIQGEPHGSQGGGDDAEAELERPRPLSRGAVYRKRRSWRSESLLFSIGFEKNGDGRGSVEGDGTVGR